MKQMKVATIVGTRPEIIRLSSVLNKLNSSEAIKHYLIHTGQNYDYELNQIFFDDLKINKPDFFLGCAVSSPIETIAKILIEVEKILEEIEPDAVLILGDTNSALSALVAKRKKIPVFHMEAGNRCFDERVPEEINRKIVDHISDINLTYSDISREYLLREGINPHKVIKTGSPMFEVLNNNLEKIKNSSILEKLNLKKSKYFVISSHREENVSNEENFFKLVDIINEIQNEYSFPIIFSAHPRTAKIINKNNIVFSKQVIITKPLGFFDYVNLQMNSYAVISDSGTISEESSILNFKAINIRETHERPEAMEEGSVMMVGLNKTRVIQALKILENQNNDSLNIVSDYSKKNVSDKVIRIILSYVDYVNQNVWKKK